MTITARKATAQHRREHAQKRGDCDVYGESVFGRATQANEGGLDKFKAIQPDPAFAALAAEQCEVLLGQLDDTLRQIAMLKLEGYGISEIADRMNCVPATVRRCIKRIQATWSEASENTEN